MYIDTGDLGENKRVFDSLYAIRQTVEERFGDELSWERLDDRRASRVAIYMEGGIDDSEEDLKGAEDSMVEKLLKFKNIVIPKLVEVSKRVDWNPK